ncbi:MAG: hypothetical protein WBE34_18710, partial [Candidatus Nitrosopolaris sp.]
LVYRKRTPPSRHSVPHIITTFYKMIITCQQYHKRRHTKLVHNSPITCRKKGSSTREKQMNSIVMNKDNYSIFDIFVKARIITGKSRHLSISNERGTKIEIACI